MGVDSGSLEPPSSPGRRVGLTFAQALGYKPPLMSTDPRQMLRAVFGHQDFRGLQAEVVAELMAGRNAVVLFPTGAGKSVCYQVPALCRPGTGVGISPLIALMRDQVEALRQAGVNAGALNSSTSPDEV